MFVYSKSKSALSTIAVAMVLGSLAVLGAVASPAHAGGYYKYSCKSCAEENGTEFETSVEGGIGMIAWGYNTSGKGVCSAIWENLGGGKWNEEYACTATGTQVEIRNGRYFTGHGQVRRYYNQYLYNLEGTEENYYG